MCKAEADTTIDTTYINALNTIPFSVEIFPNPATNQQPSSIYISSSSKHPYRVLMLDAQFKIVRDYGSYRHSQQIMLGSENLPTGLYFVQVRSAAGHLVKKLLINP